MKIVNKRHLGSISMDDVTYNKQPMGCEAQLAWKCLFTPSFVARRFGPGK